ncbi:MAG: amidohydrolase, partial [Gammaproteobacteria bacterium]|nr:amidohydrolase [Gammaproteobacteria bacterium]
MSDSKYEGLQIANPLTLENEWLAKVQEDIFDPERAIIDTHHHLWSEAGLIPYSLEDLAEDTNSGHNLIKTVFMECHSNYYTDGPEHLRSLGEVAYVTELADRSAAPNSGQAEIAALVTAFDLRQGDGVEDLVNRHHEVSKGR